MIAHEIWQISMETKRLICDLLNIYSFVMREFYTCSVFFRGLDSLLCNEDRNLLNMIRCQPMNYTHDSSGHHLQLSGSRFFDSWSDVGGIDGNWSTISIRRAFMVAKSPVVVINLQNIFKHTSILLDTCLIYFTIFIYLQRKFQVERGKKRTIFMSRAVESVTLSLNFCTLRP